MSSHAPSLSLPLSLRRLLPAVLLTLGLVATAVGLPAGPAAAATATRFSPTPVAMDQTNGPVWDLEIAGGRIYAAGAFTSTRPAGSPAGSGETNQARLAAFDATSGTRITSFAPTLTNDWNNQPGTVYATALSPDKRTLYVGGDFNLVDGQRAEHLAKFDTATGAFLGQVGWNGVNGTVRSLAVSPDGTKLYVGGAFSVANWSNRDRLAAFDLTTDAVTDWAPVISVPVAREALRVESLAVSSDGAKVFVGGPFQRMNGRTAQGIAAVNATTGATASGFRSDYFLAPSGWATTIEVAGGSVYFAGRDDGGSSSRREGVHAVNTSTGTRSWYASCYGDTFDLAVVDQEVYVASHAHDCSRAGGLGETNPTRYIALHVLDRATGRVKPNFAVQTSGVTSRPDSLLLSRALASDGNQLVMGGGFDNVGSLAQANLVRFRVR